MLEELLDRTAKVHGYAKGMKPGDEKQRDLTARSMLTTRKLI